MTSKRPDFKKSNIMANEILVASSDIASFPIKVKKVVKEWTDIQLRSFKAAKEKGIDIEAFGSEAAVTQCLDGRYIIFYNQDDIEPRIKFSILHEFGHYYLGHELNKKDEEEYGRCEVEANCFAAQILMPEQVIIELKSRGAIINKTFLMTNFGVSEEAAEKRIETLGKYNYQWRSEDEKLFDESILFKYGKFMDGILPKKNQFNWFEDEYDRQSDRDSWDFDRRSRYDRY